MKPTSLGEWLEHISAYDWRTAGLGLDRIRQVARCLGVNRIADKVITVAGTNGKGTTVMALEALLLNAGLRVGATLSPHVRRFNERFRLNGRELADEDICDALAVVHAACGEVKLTYFEYSTLAVLWSMLEADLDVAILEIGLGGRLDAFNIIDADVAVITSIGLDHQAFLGDTRDEIGLEKAGILRSHQRVVLGTGMPSSVISACQELNLEPLIAGRDFFVELPARASAGWFLRSELAELGRFADQPLPVGPCSPVNIGNAVVAASFVADISAAGVASVSESLTIPGRLERRSGWQRDFILDVAHNPEGIEFMLRELAMRDLSPQLVVCGMLEDKSHSEVCARVALYFDCDWILISTFGERAMTMTALGASVNDALAGYRVDDAPDARAALTKIISATNPGDVILAFGSFSVVEQFHETLDSAG